MDYRNTPAMQKKKIFDAIATSSIVTNCAGVDTSKSQVITLNNFAKFLETKQLELHTEEEVKDLIQACTICYYSYFTFMIYLDENHFFPIILEARTRPNIEITQLSFLWRICKVSYGQRKLCICFWKGYTWRERNGIPTVPLLHRL